MSKKYITEKALSEITGRGLQTIRNDRSQGKGFPYIKMMGKSVRYDLDEVISIMEASKIIIASFRKGGIIND